MKISDQIIEVLNYLCQKIGFTIDWTADNVLPYVEELCGKLVKWEVNTSFMWIGIMGFIVVLSLIATIIIYKVWDWDGFEWICFGIILVCAFIVIGVQIYDIITCNTFPEKFIYEYIQEAIRLNSAR